MTAEVVVEEWDPATGKTISTVMSDCDVVNSMPKLNKAGKMKLQMAVTTASSMHDLAEIEAVLEGAPLSKSLQEKLKLTEVDFETPPAPVAPAAAAPSPKPVDEVDPGLPLGALGLTSKGLVKVQEAIASASSMDLLTKLDNALTAGNIPFLKKQLQLQPEDLQGHDDDDEDEDEDYDPFATAPGPLEIIEIDKEYDPFTTAPSDLVDLDTEGETEDEDADDDEDEGEDQQEHEGTSATGGESKVGLGKLMDGYEDSDDELEAKKRAAPDESATKGKKRRKKGVAPPEPPTAPAVTTKKLAWPIAWAWLISRTRQNSEFRDLAFGPGWRHAAAVAEESSTSTVTYSKVAIATSFVYAGDTASGYDPRHLARLAVVSLDDDKEKVVLDVLVRPRLPILDYRSHLTGLQKEDFKGNAVVDEVVGLDEAQTRFLEVLRPETLVIGHRLRDDLESLQVYHAALVDVALLIGVRSRTEGLYHSLDYLADQLLDKEQLPVVDFKQLPLDAADRARVALRLAQRESLQQKPTLPLEPKKVVAPADDELKVMHIPNEWREHVQERIVGPCPGAKIKEHSMIWMLSEFDPTDWRGEAVLKFPSAAMRDAAFEKLPGLTDVHVQWTDLPGAPPLGAFLTEQGLIKAFARFGQVLSARIPRRPITREPRPFAFISFLDKKDAERVAREREIEVSITPTWNLTLRARLAKFGNEEDKRVPILLDPDEEQGHINDWVHLAKR